MFPVFSYQDKFEILVTNHPPSRSGPPHIHWCTMCGADNKYEMLKETIQIIEPYFDEIHIVDNGSTDETPSLVELSPKVTYQRIDNWNNDWTLCYFDAIKNVRYGEWFIFNDSDERPSPKLLKHLREVTQQADATGINTLSVSSCCHFYNDNGACSTNYKSVLTSDGFTKDNFVKRLNMKISAFGGHTGYHLLKRKAAPLRSFNPEFFYNHYKSISSIRVSGFTHGFIYPTSFGGLSPYASEILKVRKDLGITSIAQLFNILHTGDVPQPIYDLVSQWEFSKGEAREVWELIVRDACHTQFPTQCNQECCRYE